MAEEESDKILHVAMFPWLAFGHIIPFFEFSKRIAQKGHRISFISTPRNIQRLPKIPPELSPSINFVALNLPRDEEEENLPEGAEATSDLPPDKIPHLKKAFDKLQESLSQFLLNSPQDWIIYDFAPHWLPPIAAGLGIKRAFFSILLAGSICYLGSSSSALINDDDPRTKAEHFTVPPPWVPFHTNMVFRLHEAKVFLNHYEVNESGIKDTFRLGSVISGCEVIVVKSCFELEAQWLDLLAQLHGKPTIPIGLLLASVRDSGEDDDETWLTIRDWLGKHRRGSVVYVAFGSEANLSQHDLTELAYGLELSGLPFFWTLRKTQDSVEFPAEFEDRVKGRGIVWTSWVPQLRILAHDSVGSFLTHCGSSSIVEGLRFGRPLIMLPLAIDQGLMARVFGEKQVGAEIQRNEDDGVFTRISVAEALLVVTVEEKGRIYREKAKEMRPIFADEKLHDRYVGTFVEFLLNYKPGSKS